MASIHRHLDSRNQHTAKLKTRSLFKETGDPHHHVQQGLGHTHPPIQWVPGAVTRSIMAGA